jgi:hypothetical protein
MSKLSPKDAAISLVRLSHQSTRGQCVKLARTIQPMQKLSVITLEALEILKDRLYNIKAPALIILLFI